MASQENGPNVLFSGKKALVVLPLECVGPVALLPVCFKEMWEENCE